MVHWLTRKRKTRIILFVLCGFCEFIAIMLGFGVGMVIVALTR